MAFNERSLVELELDALAAGRYRLPEANWSRNSDQRRRLQVLVTVAWHLQAEIARVERDILPDTSTEPGLTRWAGMLRVPRNGPSVSGRDAALRIRGTAGSSISDGALLTHEATGGQFRIVGTYVIPASTTVDADVLSITTGSVTRLDAGELLLFDSPSDGVETEAELVLELLGGDDQEELEAWRLRVLRRFVESGALVTDADWKARPEATDAVDKAFTYPHRNGVGTVDLAVLRNGRGAMRLLTTDELAAIRSDLEAHRMVAMRGWRLLTVTTQAVDFEIEVIARPNTSAWDWGDATSLAISAYDAGTRTITLASARPDDLTRGQRLVIEDVGSVLPGSVSTVLETPGVDQIVIDRDFGYVWSSGDVLWPAGALTEPVRSAILAYMDSLGPAFGEYGFGTWEDSARLSRVEAAVFTAVPDVRTLAFVEPAVDIIPADPPPGLFDDHVLLLVPGRVLVRRAA